jgi:hypothetical protein
MEESNCFKLLKADVGGDPPVPSVLHLPFRNKPPKEDFSRIREYFD